ncbi:DEAD/DEAH box helicase [Candidatus Magnetaquicoccus inordinatus]|uniref:preprotein translocase subunit SecA n=1 Tax=Candidatus Magnetaquicoccus inordinatus TaxID=2496818 RepID=UPI00102CBDFE|nr:DEAD/DEAH box helicase [Candidatus Magnetaquicoccus inordinatus]
MKLAPAQLLLGDLYPQRRLWQELPWLDRLATTLHLRWSRRKHASTTQQDQFLAEVAAAEQRLQALTKEEGQKFLAELRRKLRQHGFVDATVAMAFAFLRQQAGELLAMRHFPTQMRGGYLLLHGYVVEMDTGEGKTLTATLTAATAALAGLAVHVVTVNDYLAERDSQRMAPLYKACGLSTGVILESMSPEEKQQQYAADIVYCTNKTLVFDYLRDRLQMGDHLQPLSMAIKQLTQPSGRALLLRGLQFAIVDEADSIFIDEARTPLILASERSNPLLESFYRQAISVARQLQAESDFILAGRDPQLTQHGQSRLLEISSTWGGLWNGALRAEEVVRLALSALYGFTRDVHYIVRNMDGVAKVMIVDEHTGRVMPDRSWERGLQQLIEIKEDVPLTPEKEVLARISYQLFFRRYLYLSGMTGTCREVKEELADVYGLGVIRLQPYRPSRRTLLPTRLFATAEARWQAVVEAVRQRAAHGQALLVGTRSIAASEHLSALLQAADLPHRLLNAKQDKLEADLIAEAGRPGQVTIATNMAGRGTDIRPEEKVLQAGGLHVILTEGHDNARVDRQLIGRSARQGDPGTAESLLSLEDELLRERMPTVGAKFAILLKAYPQSRLLQRVAATLYRLAQWHTERGQRRIRRRLLQADFQMRQALSFSGKME